MAEGGVLKDGEGELEGVVFDALVKRHRIKPYEVRNVSYIS